MTIGTGEGPKETAKSSIKDGRKFTVGAPLLHTVTSAGKSIAVTASALKDRMNSNPAPRMPVSGGVLEQELKSELKEFERPARFLKTFKSIENSSESIQSTAQRMERKGRSILKWSSKIELSGGQVKIILRMDQLRSGISEKVKDLKLPGFEKEVSFKNINSEMQDVLKLCLILSAKDPDTLTSNETNKLIACDQILDEYSEILGQAEEVFDTSMTQWDGDVNIDNMQFAMGRLAQLDEQLETKGQTIQSFTTENVLSDFSGSRNITARDIRTVTTIRSKLNHLSQRFHGRDVSMPLFSVTVQELRESLNQEMKLLRKDMISEPRSGDTEGSKSEQSEIIKLKEIGGELTRLFSDSGVDIEIGSEVAELFGAYNSFVEQHGDPAILNAIGFKIEQRQGFEAIMKDKTDVEALLGKELTLELYSEVISSDPNLHKGTKKLMKRMKGEIFEKSLANFSKFEQALKGLKTQPGENTSTVFSRLDQFHKIADILFPVEFIQVDQNPTVLQLKNNSWDVIEAVIAEMGLEAVISGNANDRLEEVQNDYNDAIDQGPKEKEAWVEKILSEGAVAHSGKPDAERKSPVTPSEDDVEDAKDRPSTVDSEAYSERMDTLQGGFQEVLNSYEKGRTKLTAYQDLYTKLKSSRISEEEKSEIRAKLEPLSEEIISLLGSGQEALEGVGIKVKQTQGEIVQDVRSRVAEESRKFEALRGRSRSALPDKATYAQKEMELKERKLELNQAHTRLRELKSFQGDLLKRQEEMSAALEDMLAETIAAQRALKEQKDPTSLASMTDVEATVR